LHPIAVTAMPISIRFLVLCRPAFTLLLKVRFEPPSAPLYGPRVADAQQAILVRELSKRLPPHLVRDVLPDGE
jgi:hypothetical protein